MWNVADQEESFRMILGAHDNQKSTMTCILVGSTRTGPAIKVVEKYSNMYNFYVLESGPDRRRPESIEKVSKGKIGVRTTFAAKGLEWDTVVYLGLSGYHMKRI